jgi:hypothetical protein
MESRLTGPERRGQISTIPSPRESCPRHRSICASHDSHVTVSQAGNESTPELPRGMQSTNLQLLRMRGRGSETLGFEDPGSRLIFARLPLGISE